VYFSHQFILRSFHCSSLTLLSIKNTIYYREAILNPNHSLQKLYLHSNQSNTNINTTFYHDEHFYLKIIIIYFMVYICYDLKNCLKRIDLLIHHIVCLTWGYVNFTYFLGFISFLIMCEGITFAYTFNTFKKQLIYRVIFTSLVRFPAWILTFLMTIYHYHYYFNYTEANNLIILFNSFISCIMILMDCIWFTQNLKKLKQIYKCECECNNLNLIHQ
jgi:hypothetical protein